MTGPLTGIRVIDFTWVGVGPFATKFLADLGADVIKIESATRPDVIRVMRPAAGGKPGLNRSGYFANRNSSKRSISLNLKHHAAVELARELIRGADVVINNYSPGVMDRMGLSYESVSRENPRIIYVDMSMMGRDGPLSQFRGYGAMVNAMSGLYGLTGIPGQRPVGTGTNFPDHVPNPLHAAVAILGALYARLETGRGTYVEVAQLESSINLLGPYVMAALNGGPEQGPLGNQHPAHFPQGVFRCRDGWCAVTIRTERQWAALCDLLGREDWREDVGLSSPEGRRSLGGEIEAGIAAWMEGRTRLEAMAALQAHSIPAGAVQDAREVLEDTNLAHRGHWVRLNHPEMGQTVYDGPVARLSATPARLSRPAPLLGEHTREVCAQLLGLSEETFAQLKAEGVFD